jgi:hypothetical protein
VCSAAAASEAGRNLAVTAVFFSIGLAAFHTELVLYDGHGDDYSGFQSDWPRFIPNWSLMMSTVAITAVFNRTGPHAVLFVDAAVSIGLAAFHTKLVFDDEHCDLASVF